MIYEYCTLEYRSDNAARDIQQLMEQWSQGGWMLKFILESERVLVLERAVST